MRDRHFYVYLMSNPGRTVLYTGVTNNLLRRVWEHKEKVVEGFTQKYNARDLVYYEVFETPNDAIRREKQIKSWSRTRKEQLVSSLNPTRKDLYPEITSW